MPQDIHDLAARIAGLCRDIRDIRQADLADACTIAEDILADEGSDRARDVQILAGLRWGHDAATHVAIRGGAVVHLFLPGGGLTYHLKDARSKDTERRIGIINQILIDDPEGAT